MDYSWIVWGTSIIVFCLLSLSLSLSIYIYISILYISLCLILYVAPRLWTNSNYNLWNNLKKLEKANIIKPLSCVFLTFVAFSAIRPWKLRGSLNMSYNPKSILRFNYIRNQAIHYCLVRLLVRVINPIIAPSRMWYRNKYIQIKSDFRL